MAWFGRGIKDHQVPTCLPQAGSPTSRSGTRPVCLGTHLVLNISRDGASTTPLGSLFQHLTTLTIKSFPLTSNLNLPSFNLQSFSLVLLLSTLSKS